jgi:opacity protein-like surface antigen|tara:strand:+ start:208 stop:618 length:411 start_codon:yes stop_codon:yes gene_type:complete
MKKMFLTMVLAFVTIVSSAQFMVVTTIDQPEENAEWEMSNITDNLGIGYQFENGITIGAMKNGEEYDLWGRYQLKMGYLSVQAPTEEMTDNLKVGVGYSLKIWNELYIEPNYSMPVKEDAEGNREGEFKVGISYKL